MEEENDKCWESDHSSSEGEEDTRPAEESRFDPDQVSDRSSDGLVLIEERQGRKEKKTHQYDKKWASEVDKRILQKRVETGDVRWSNLLKLWQTELQEVEYDELTMGSENGALRAIQRLTWLGGLTQNGRVAFEAVKHLGDKLLNPDQLTSDNFWDLLSQQGVDTSDLSHGSEVTQKSQAETILLELRSCPQSELRKRLEEEKKLGFIPSVLRANKYRLEEIQVIANNILKHARLLVSSEEEETQQDLVLDRLGKLLESHNNGLGEIQALLDATADLFLRNSRIFKDAQHRELDTSTGSDSIIVATDPTEPPTAIDNWFIEEGATDAISPKYRKLLIEEEKAWYAQHLEAAHKFCGIVEDPSKRPLPEVFTTNVDKRDEGTQRDSITARLRRYATKKNALRQLQKKATLLHCLAEACTEEQHQLTGGYSKQDDIPKMVLVIGYQLEKGKVSVDSSPSAPVVVRHIPVKLDDHGPMQHRDIRSKGELVEIGARLDGQYVVLPSSLCTDARDRVIDSALPLSSKDEIIFCEFIPSEEHVPGSLPLESLLKTSRNQIESESAIHHTLEGTVAMSNEQQSNAASFGLTARSPSRGNRALSEKTSPDQKHLSQLAASTRQRQHHGFTHVLLEIPEDSVDKRRGPEREAYTAIKDSGYRYLISLVEPGKVEMESMRLPSIPVLPRSSVAQRQGALSFRRFLLLLPASMHTLEGKDETIRALTKPTGEIKGFVESAETLAQLMSIIIERATHNERGTQQQLVKERLKSNALILNCMSVRSLATVDVFFQQGIQQVWREILELDKMWQDLNEQTAAEILFGLIVGDDIKPSTLQPLSQRTTTRTEPYPSAIATDVVWHSIPEILRKGTKFNSEILEVEKSNFQSVMLFLRKRMETSVPYFYMVQLTGEVTLTMFEKLIDCARESVSIKIVFLASPQVVKLVGRLSNELKGKLFQHPRVLAATETSSPLACVEGDSLLGALQSAGRMLDNRAQVASSIKATTLARVDAELQWVEEIDTWFTSCKNYFAGMSEPRTVEQNTLVLVGQDPLEVGRQLLSLAMSGRLGVSVEKLKCINARDQECFADLSVYLHGQSVHSTSQPDSFSVVILEHAQLLPHDRLSVVATRCASKQTPLLIVVDCPTREISCLSIKDEQGYPSYRRIRTVQFRPVCEIPLHAFRDSTRRVVLGFQMLLGPDIFGCEKDVEEVNTIVENALDLKARNRIHAARAFPRLKDFPRYDTNGLDCLERIWTILEDDKLPIWMTEENEILPEKTLLGELVAGILRLYLQHGKCASAPVRYSFPDFAEQAPVLFFSQETRLELFLLSLLDDVDEPALVVKLREWVLSLRVEYSFQVQNEKLNVSHTKHPGPILCAVRRSDVASLNRESVKYIKAYYVDSERGDQLSREAEAVERSAINCMDLNWNSVYAKWPRAAGLPGPVLDHVLRESPLRLLILLSLSKNRISTMHYTPETLDVLEKDMQNSQFLLEHPEAATKCHNLEERRAALAWSLVRNGSINNLTLSSERFGALVTSYHKSKLHFDFGEEVDLARNLATCLLGLDEPRNALLDQPNVVGFLLNKTFEWHVAKLIDQLPKIGCAFISLCANSKWRDMLKLKQEQIRDRMGPLISWFTGGTLDDAMARTTLQEFLTKNEYKDWYLRFTPRAVAEMVHLGAEKALDDQELFEEVVGKFVLRFLDREDGQAFFKQFVKHLAGDFSQPHIRSCIVACECLIKDERARQCVASIQWSSQVPEEAVIECLLASLVHGQLDLETLTQYHESVQLVGSRKLMMMYVECFWHVPSQVESGASLSEDLRIHKLFFDPETLRAQLFESALASVTEYMRDSKTPRRENRRLLWLLWFLWAKLPERNLPSILFPSCEAEFKEFRATVKEDLPKACRNTRGPLSLLAKFATMPHSLTQSALTAVRRQMKGHASNGGDTVAFGLPQKLFTLAQKGHKLYPEYSLRVDFARELPRDCLRKVLLDVQEEEIAVLAKQFKDHPRVVFPRIQEGFSRGNFVHNVALLCSLNQVGSAFQQSGFIGQREGFIEHIGLCVTAWLTAAGVRVGDLCKLFKSGSPLLREFSRSMKELLKLAKGSMAGRLVYCPLPVLVDVHFVDEDEKRSAALFDSDDASAQMTAQNVALLFHLFDSDTSRTRSNLYTTSADELASRVLALKELKGDVLSESAQIVKDLFIHIGQALIKMETLDPDRVLAIASFLSQLTRAHLLRAALGSMLEGIDMGDTEKRNALVPRLFDLLFVFIGITPKNEGVQLLMLVKEFSNWRANRDGVAFVGNQVFSEIEFMTNNVFRNYSESIKMNSANILTLVTNEPRAEGMQVRFAAVDDTVFNYVSGFLDLLTRMLDNPNIQDKEVPDPVRNYSDCLVGELIPFREKLSDQEDLDAQNHKTATTGAPKSAEKDPGALRQQKRKERVAATTASFSLFKRPMEEAVSENFETRGTLSGAASGALGDDESKPRLVSARTLLRLQTFPSYGVLQVSPGLHPVLRKPAQELDGENFARHRPLLNSFDHEDASLQGTIANVFSNNGETWELLQHLPSDSTVCATGFYLRKTLQGKLAFLAPTFSVKEVATPSFFMADLVGTHRMAGLHLDQHVVDAFCALLLLSYREAEARHVQKKVDMEDSLQRELKRVSKEIKRVHRELDQLLRGTGQAKAQEDELVGVEHLEQELRDKLEQLGEQQNHLEQQLEQYHQEDVDSNAEEEDDEASVYSEQESADSNEHASGDQVSVVSKEDEEADNSLEKETIHVLAQLQRVRRKDLFFFETYLEVEQEVVQHVLDSVKLVQENPRQAAGNLIVRQVLDVARNVRKASLKHVQSALATSISTVMVMTSHVPRSQLKFSLQLVYRNHSKRHVNRGTTRPMNLNDSDQNDSNRLVAAHAHILQEKFRRTTLELLQSIEEDPQIEGSRTFTQEFPDSDNEDDDDEFVAGPCRREIISSTPSGGEQHQVVDEHVHCIGEREVDAVEEYPDACLDIGERSQFDASFKSGYGPNFRTTTCAWTLDGSHAPLYFVPIDTRELKLSYSDAHGLPIAYMFHRRVLQRRLKEVAEEAAQKTTCRKEKENIISMARDKLIRWLANLVRSPLPAAVKQLMLETLRHGSTSPIAPSLSGRSRENARSEADQEWEQFEDDVNLKVIQNCIAAALPVEEPARVVLTSTYTIDKFVRSLIIRANDRGHDTYGVHIVKASLLERVKQFGIRPTICDLGHDSLINARDVASMYLKIIGCFNEQTWLVWVRGLSTIKDQLLKWIAEYTKHHPWRFVYLEECDVSWNFGENRDRCVLTRAPQSVASYVRRLEDLDMPFVKSHRPCHSYEVESTPMLNLVMQSKTWDAMQKHTCLFFQGDLFSNSISSEDSEGDASKEFDSWYPSDDEGETSELSGSAVEEGQSAQEGLSSSGESSWKQFELKEGNEDYRKVVERMICQEGNCAVMLVSPPGAGKSYFSKELTKKLQNDYGLTEAYLDGSDDELVYTALLSVLNRKVPPDSQVFLVIDEYHMLSSQHKRELFAWFEKNIHRLHVLMIANRKDASDDAFLDTLRGGNITRENVISVEARLPEELINEVIEKNNVKKKELARVWFHLSRSLFGGESISLRFLPTLDVALQQSGPDRLASLKTIMSSKLPRISPLTVNEFVQSFLVATSHTEEPGAKDELDVLRAVEAVSKAVCGPVATMVQAALLTIKEDHGLDFPSFVENELRGANDIPPSIKIASWCCLMQCACDEGSEAARDAMSPPTQLFESVFIDQVGFPHQLQDKPLPSNKTVWTFSWGGSYESLSDMTDAVRRGHSINWQDVYEREWKYRDVTSLSELVVLLSACRRPGSVLKALKPSNLVSLMQGSLSDDALKLAYFVLENKVGRAEANTLRHENPYYAAVWTIITCEKKPLDLRAFCPTLVSVEDLALALEWAPVHVSSLTETRADDIERRTKDIVLLLHGLSKWFIKHEEKHLVPRIWRGFFAGLVEPAKRKDVAHYIAEFETDEQDAWSPEMCALWRIAQGRAGLDEIEHIWSSKSCRGCLFQSPAPNAPLYSSFATGLILSNRSVIPVEIQLHILKTPTVINDRATFQQVEQRLRAGIEQIARLGGTVETLPDDLKTFLQTKLQQQQR